MTRYICNVCSWIYDPKIGEPSQSIPPGIPFENLPDNFLCPDCGVGKDQFSPLAD